MRYEDTNDFDTPSMMQRQKDIVLATNEFCFVLSRTNGVIKTYTGPITLTISAQESLVSFNSNTKRFEETSDINRARQLFTSAPEGWYAVLKNPTYDNSHPEPAKGVNAPELSIGKKINIAGPCTFSLFPGQMAKVIQGHKLRSNQYLIARVYDAEAASNSTATIVDAEGKKIEVESQKYFVGQLLVIKGTEVSFYIPPTGIEVLPAERGSYVRDAITLERLEYCILKDESGDKTYKHGPAVVFPKPTESFVASPKGSYIFRAIELSKISGIYIKVIAEYTDENGVVHPIGEEQFITGNDQMIYYPRPEHAVINYDSKITHHAIAIPEGEGRYVMNRLTGEIKTVKGPAMYLPDPRTEVIVKRKLTPSQCQLWYPGNNDVLAYNKSLSEKSVENRSKSIDLDAFTSYCATNSVDTTLANLEAKANISRGTSYTKPRTVMLDTKYDGVVSLDVWTGYAVNLVSKDGTRKVICGPQTVLLDYDQTLETLAEGNAKTVFLAHKNNRLSSTVNVETADFIPVSITLTYTVDFDDAQKDKWFDISNYGKYLCNKMNVAMKKEAKNHDIEDFNENYTEIIRELATSMKFEENGMVIKDVDVMVFNIQPEIAVMLDKHRKDLITKRFELTMANKRIDVVKALADAEKLEQDLRTQQVVNKMEVKRIEAMRQMEIQNEINRQKEAEQIAAKQAEKDLQVVLDTIADANRERKQKDNQLNIEYAQAQADIEKAKQEAYAATVAKIMESVSDDLVAALNAKSNADILDTVSHAVAPYAIARGESISDVANKLLRGTTLEGIVENISTK